jgi:hypothetical protein
VQYNVNRGQWILLGSGHVHKVPERVCLEFRVCVRFLLLVFGVCSWLLSVSNFDSLDRLGVRNCV